MQHNLVIIPTYNEKENIEDIIRTVFEKCPDFHLLIVDDSSPDGTSDLVKILQSTFPEKLFLEIRKEKDGLGQAYIHGFHWALERNYEAIYEMDADFSHNPEDLNRLKQALENNYDVAIGSRYSHGVNVVNWPMNRVFLSYGASKYVQWITGMPIADPTAGFIGYRDYVLRDLNLNQIKFKGYGFQIEMKYKIWKKGYKIIEIPIIFKDRERGESKISRNIIWEAVIGVINLRWQSLIGKL